jgi:hypothetical protein
MNVWGPESEMYPPKESPNKVKLKMNANANATLLNLNNPSFRDRTNMGACNRVLTFVAESVNLYNWYLRRTPNPRRQLYDETEEVMRKLFEEVYKRAKEEPDVSIKLKDAVCMFDLAEDVENEVYDEDVRNAGLWSEFVQRRQRELALEPDEEDGDYARERMLWRVVANTTDAPALYIKLFELEDEYLAMLVYGDVIIDDEETTLAESLYNSFELEIVPPPAFGVAEAFGVDEVELERVYLRDPYLGPEEEEDEDEEYQNENYFEAPWDQYVVMAA